MRPSERRRRETRGGTTPGDTCRRPRSAAAYFAFDVREPDGTFVAKALAEGAEGELQKLLKQRFKKVMNIKPPSSRADSSEKFVVATGYRGSTNDDPLGA